MLAPLWQKTIMIFSNKQNKLREEKSENKNMIDVCKKHTRCKNCPLAILDASKEGQNTWENTFHSWCKQRSYIQKLTAFFYKSEHRSYITFVLVKLQMRTWLDSCVKMHSITLLINHFAMCRWSWLHQINIPSKEANSASVWTTAEADTTLPVSWRNISSII